MGLKLKRILAVTMMCIMGFSSVSAFAEGGKEDWKNKGPSFMGKVIEVQKNEKDNNIRVKVKGYISGCEVYEEELIAIVNNETKIITNGCKEENKPEVKNEKDGENKCKPTDVDIKVGDNVFIRLDKAMTMSLPPQSVAKKMQITRPKS